MTLIFDEETFLSSLEINRFVVLLTASAVTVILFNVEILDLL